GIEGRKTQLLERLAPPKRHQAPPHLDELALAVMFDNRVRRIGRTGIKARLKVGNRRRRRQAIERANLLPRVVASEPSAHLGNIGDQRPSLYHRAQFEPPPRSFGLNRSPPNLMRNFS